MLNNPKPMLRCRKCGFSGYVEDFKPAYTCYHDAACKKCGTTDIDTSEINKDWALKGKVYGFGDNNIQMRFEGK